MQRKTKCGFARQSIATPSLPQWAAWKKLQDFAPTNPTEIKAYRGTTFPVLHALLCFLSFTHCVMQSPTYTSMMCIVSPNGHTARNPVSRWCVCHFSQGLPLNGKYLRIFSLKESVITCGVHEVCRSSENYMLAWFSIIAYSQPSVVHRQMKPGAGRTKGGRIPRSAVVLWIQLDETQFSQNCPVLVLSDHGQRVALSCLEFELNGPRYDLVLGHPESLTE